MVKTERVANGEANGSANNAHSQQGREGDGAVKYMR